MSEFFEFLHIFSVTKNEISFGQANDSATGNDLQIEPGSSRLAIKDKNGLDLGAWTVERYFSVYE